MLHIHVAIETADSIYVRYKRILSICIHPLYKRHEKQDKSLFISDQQNRSFGFEHLYKLYFARCQI